jgi:DNA-binding transcriptional MerR regulator
MEAIEQALARIPDKSYYRIGEVARITGVKPYVLRYWETEFKAIVPPKSRSKQRMYRRKDIENILLIKHLLYRERFTIEGARKRLAERNRPAGRETPPAEPGPSIDLSALRSVRVELERLRDQLAGG